MGILRDILENKKSSLISDITTKINDHFDALLDYPNKEDDRSETITLYTDEINNYQSNIDNFFSPKPGDIVNQFRTFILYYLQSKNLYKIDMPETANLYDDYLFDFEDKYTSDVFNDYISITADDIWGGVVYNPAAPGTPETPDFVTLNAVLTDSFSAMIDNELSMMTNLNSGKNDSNLNIGMKIQYMVDAGTPIPQRDPSSSPFLSIVDYMNSSTYNFGNVLFELGLDSSISLPEGVPA